MRLSTLVLAILSLTGCDPDPVAETSQRSFLTIDNHRMFTAFFESPTSGAPLLVFWNGGPGAATTTGLLANGTAPMRVSYAKGGFTGLVEENQDSFLSIGSLLYIDAPNTGFSYDLESAAPFDMAGDARTFAAAIATFIDTHPGVGAGGIVIVGESYGGARAQLVIDTLFTEEAYASVARQVRGQVLIQPAVVGKYQEDLLPEATSTCVDDSDDITGCAHAVIAESILSREGDRTKLLGGGLDDVEGFIPEDREGARRLITGTSEYLDPALRDEYGALPPGDSYFEARGPTSSQWSEDLSLVPSAFARNLARIPTMITNARYDQRVRSPTIAEAMHDFGVPAAFDATMFGGARPGGMTVSLPTGTATVRMPIYEAGHMVPARASAQLREDVATWLAASGSRESWFADVP